MSPVRITVKNGISEVIAVTPDYDPIEHGNRYPPDDYRPGAYLASQGPYTVEVDPPFFSRRSVLYHEGGTSLRQFVLQIGSGGNQMPGAETFEDGRVRISHGSKRSAEEDAHQPTASAPGHAKTANSSAAPRKTSKPKHGRRGGSRKAR